MYPVNTKLLLIGTDPSPIVLSTGEVMFTATNLSTVEAAIRKPTAVVIVSTYSSSHFVQKALNSTGQRLQLSIFDEVHRVCGSAEPSAFNAILLAPPAGSRIFLTATPTYDTPLRMDNTDVFGRCCVPFASIFAKASRWVTSMIFAVEVVRREYRQHGVDGTKGVRRR